jgi:anthranilate phosphoribosyltransferase
LIVFFFFFSTIPFHVRRLIDLVGTGGDGRDAFNVSTASALVCAAGGLRVAKHGNRSSSGSVGSSDFLEALGAPIDLDGPACAACLDACGMAFLFAPTFHPAMRHVAAARKMIGCRTLFNLLGPLANPARPQAQVTGVGEIGLGRVFADARALAVAEDPAAYAGTAARGVVVHSADGLDEVSVSDATWVWAVDGSEVLPADKVRAFVLGPDDAAAGAAPTAAAAASTRADGAALITTADLGVDTHPLDAVCGGDAAQRAARFRALVARPDDDPPLRDFVAVNAGLGFFVAGTAATARQGVQAALGYLRDGSVARVLGGYLASATTEAAAARARGGGGDQTATATAATTGAATAAPGDNILDRIMALRTADVEADIAASGERLEAPWELEAEFAPINLYERLTRIAGRHAVIAEVKRASPSKGQIARDDFPGPAAQALRYAAGGAAAISVLTETRHFKGTFEDMTEVRRALECV